MMRVHAFDIGGANIKAASAWIDEAGATDDLRAIVSSFALWKAPHELYANLRSMQEKLGHSSALVFTMTAELCDCFASRREGVEFILDEIARMTSDVMPVRFWSTRQGFVDLSTARQNWSAIASANWHAQATCLAQQYPTGHSLMLDVGSTTTDIIKLKDGAVCAQGMTDAQRLLTGELIYTGASRTSLMAVMNQWRNESQTQRFMGEHFATMADVYTLLGELPEDETDCDTADGKPRTRLHAATRMLRMIGGDHSTLPDGMMEVAMMWASRFAAQQLEHITQGIAQVVSDDSLHRVIITGSGAFVAQRAAVKALPGCDVVRWEDRFSSQASVAACAVALLMLWGNPRTGVRGL